eukprot:363331-Chlamydomonas_euryale.AAC.1
MPLTAGTAEPTLTSEGSEQHRTPRHGSRTLRTSIERAVTLEKRPPHSSRQPHTFEPTNYINRAI